MHQLVDFDSEEVIGRMAVDRTTVGNIFKSQIRDVVRDSTGRVHGHVYRDLRVGVVASIPVEPASWLPSADGIPVVPALELKGKRTKGRARVTAGA